MAQGTGTATLSFPAAAQSAQYDAPVTTVKDSVPNPNLKKAAWNVAFMNSLAAINSAGNPAAASPTVACCLTTSPSSLTSSDGVTWTNNSTLPAGTNNMFDLSYQNGHFILSGGTTMCIAFSSDGVTWTDKTTATLTGLSMLGTCWDGTQYVSTANGSSSIFTSATGATWAQFSGTLPGTAGGKIWYLNGKYFINGGGSSLFVCTGSPSVGANWATRTYPSGISTGTLSVSYGGGKYFAAGSNAGLAGGVCISSDAVTWTDITPPGAVSSGASFSGSYLNGLYIAVERNTLTGGLTMFTTSDFGVTWSRSAVYDSVVDDYASVTYVAQAIPPIYFNSTYLVCGVSYKRTGGSNLLSSSDGFGGGSLASTVRTVTTTSPQLKPAVAVPGSNTASVTVTGLTTFTATDSVEAWIMAYDTTATHNGFEHAVAPIKLRVTNPITGVGFTIQATSEWRLTGDFKVRYVFTS